MRRFFSKVSYDSREICSGSVRGVRRSLKLDPVDPQAVRRSATTFFISYELSCYTLFAEVVGKRRTQVSLSVNVLSLIRTDPSRKNIRLSAYYQSPSLRYLLFSKPRVSVTTGPDRADRSSVPELK